PPHASGLSAPGSGAGVAPGLQPGAPPGVAALGRRVPRPVRALRLERGRGQPAPAGGESQGDLDPARARAPGRARAGCPGDHGGRGGPLRRPRGRLRVRIGGEPLPAGLCLDQLVRADDARRRPLRRSLRMAPDAGTDRDALIERLTSSGNQFDFVQAMSLLEAVSGDGTSAGEAGPLAREALRLRSNPELGFPPGDVHAIRRRPGKPERFEVVLNFMGLSGVSSPLPAYFTDMVAKQLEGGEPMREFLAIFE